MRTRAAARPTAVRAGRPRPPAACELGVERVERLGERRQRVGEPSEPGARSFEPGFVQGIEPAGALGARGHEAGVAEHLEVLRDRGLRDRLRLQRRDDLARRLLTRGEQLQDLPAGQVAEKPRRRSST